MKVIGGGITAPKGFFAASVSCGIKKSGRNDLALLTSELPAVTAGVFTTNRFKSGSLILTEGRLKKGVSQALIVNSGNANCCVGAKELKDAVSITDSLSERLMLPKELILIASTGVIGKALPVDKIRKALLNLVKDLKETNSSKFARAIMTTDTVPKEVSVIEKVGGKQIRIGGAAKGSGMICPNMATMLAFFTTDASIETNTLRQAFRECVANSFNRITVDGDMSTNDASLIFANGLAGNKLIRKGSRDYFKFLGGLDFVAKTLARKIVMDGEGATKFIEVLVRGAEDEGKAEKIARRIAGSNLVKTMIAGGDPNWGRIAASIGSSGADIKKNRVHIYLGRHLVMKNGAGTDVSRKTLVNLLKNKELRIIIDLRSGTKTSWLWTCDLTEEYVRINAEYET